MTAGSRYELLPSFLIGFAANFTLLNRERILAPVSRELALSLRLAGSQVIRQWLLDDDNPAKKSLALLEAEGYRRDFKDQSYFLISALSNRYYFNDRNSPYSAAPRYSLKPDDEHDAWFYNTIKNTASFNINVDPDVKLQVTKIWFNVIVKDGDRKIGIAGTGLDLSSFLHDFIATAQPGVTPIIVDVNGAIQAHPDGTRIAYNSATKAALSEHSLFGLFDRPADAAAARAVLEAAIRRPGKAEGFTARMRGKDQLLAVSYIPELKWHVLTAVDLKTAQVVDLAPLAPLAAALAALLLLAMTGFVYALNRLVLSPLLQLKQSAQAMAAGNYEVALPPVRADEIGELSAAFGSMAAQVRRHTEQLEGIVRERTLKLMHTNQEMAAAHSKINDSIAYASMIQRAILPDRRLAAASACHHSVFWRPRDVVGGDFYVYREMADGCLLGLIDCAGHGVPGALMTMLAHAAVNQAIDEADCVDPAGILARTDQAVRNMLHIDNAQRDIATEMDAAFVHLDFKAGRIVFAGAKIALHWCDENGEVQSVKGGRRALGARQPGIYRNQTVQAPPSRTFYLSTDGFLDQAGGEKGYGFGNARFAAMLRQHANLSLSEQGEAFVAALANYQGAHPQRDDITMMCFRFAGYQS